MGIIKSYFEEKYGEPNEVKESEYSNFYIWDTEDENTILEIGKEIGKGFIMNVLNIFLTSAFALFKLL